MSSIPPNFVLGEPAILYLLRGGLEDFWGPHAFQRGMVGKNQSSWQSTKGGTIENSTTLEGGVLGILQSLVALR